MNEFPQTDQEAVKRSSRRRAVAIVFTSVGLLVVVALVLYLRSGPANGVIHQGTPTTSELTPNVQDRLVPYNDDPSLAFSYLSSYHLSSTKLEETNVVSRAEFLASRPSYKQLEVYVIKEQGIDDDSSVHYRRLYPQLYKEEPLDSGGLHGTVFTRTDQGFERIAFFSQGGYVGVVALTISSSDLKTGMSDFSRVLGTVHWK